MVRFQKMNNSKNSGILSHNRKDLLGIKVRLAKSLNNDGSVAKVCESLVRLTGGVPKGTSPGESFFYCARSTYACGGPCNHRAIRSKRCSFCAAQDTTKPRHAGDSYHSTRMPATNLAGRQSRGQVPTGFFRSLLKKGPTLVETSHISLHLTYGTVMQTGGQGCASKRPRSYGNRADVDFIDAHARAMSMYDWEHISSQTW